MARFARHHLVPPFLLRRFADQDGKLVMVKRDDLGVSLLSSVNKACNEAGFYRIETDDLEPRHRHGHDPEAVEKALAAYEGDADRSIRNLLTGEPPWAVEDHYNLAMFTAFQYVRGWRFRRQVDDLETLTMRRMMLADPDKMQRSAKRFLAARGESATPEAVAAFIESATGPDGPRLVQNQSHAVQTSFRFALEVLAPMLIRRRIRLLRFKPDTPLLTSDSPVVTWSPQLPEERVISLEDAVTITLPLSPSAALSFVRGGRDTVAASGRIRARQINTAAADIADRWIYHSPDTQPLDGLPVPADKPHWVDERIASRIDEDGNYRELWQTVQR